MYLRISNKLWCGLLVLGLSTADVLAMELNEDCTVSVLNRTVRVQADGSWSLPNVPTNFGQVRARATCVESGITRSGQSDFFVVPTTGFVELPTIILGAVDPIPATLEITAPPVLTSLTAAQLTVTANFSDGSSADFTASSTGTNYTVSNPAFATVSAEGLLTPLTSGTVLVSAINEGALGVATIQMTLSGDMDGDGIPDDLELLNGMDPNNPVDALEDFDGDGLTNVAELITFGTDLRDPDTDGDGLADGEETVAGEDGFISNPLLLDTDADGIRDGLEVATGSDPSDPNSFNLAAALDSVAVMPSVLALTVNTIVGEAFRQLAVIGQLSDGTSIDLTSATRGTNYDSNDLTVCNFGAPDGRVFAGINGFCTITVTSNGFIQDVYGVVTSFAPTALSFVTIPGFANDVEVKGDYAYVAAGATGVQIVSVADRSAPFIATVIDTPGNANDIKIAGDTAFVADGSAGLQVIDITNPLLPAIVGTLDTAGTAKGLAIRNNQAFIADGAAGLQVIDITNPNLPSLTGTIDTPGDARGVDVDLARAVAVVADATTGIQVIDISNLAAPGITALDTGTAQDVSIVGTTVLVADFANSLTAVDITTINAPVIADSTTTVSGGLQQDVEVEGTFAFSAEEFFVNGVPIVDVSTPTVLSPRTILDFSSFRADNGNGIAVDSNYVYLVADTAGPGIKYAANGNSQLYIGQYLALEDTFGQPPVVNIISPSPGDTVFEGATVSLQATATDDVGVLAVEFLVDGVMVFSDAAPPYAFDFTVPTGVAGITISARAVDPGGNQGVAADVVLNVIPDPGTTAIGSVVDGVGAPVDGATIVCKGTKGVSVIDGTFSIPGVPALGGDISCVASYITGGGQKEAGVSDLFAAVLNGTTDVGQIGAVFPVELIRNGDFEAPVGPAGTFGNSVAGPFRRLSAGSPAIANWMIGGANIDFFLDYPSVGSLGPGADGLNRVIDINGAGAGELTQSFSTLSGEVYTIDFDLTGSANVLIRTMDVIVLGADGVTELLSQTIALDTSALGSTFTPQSLNFVADGDQATLRFVSTIGGFLGFHIDNVVVDGVLAAFAREDLIDFETGFVDNQIITTLETATNIVTVTGGTANMRIATPGAPITAFDPNDTPASGNPGDAFLTNGTSGTHDAYYFTFDSPINSFSLDLYDYRAEGGGGFLVVAGDTATLTLYSDIAMTTAVGQDIFTVPAINPPDGNVVPLAVLNPAADVRAVSLVFSGNDTGTAVDNIIFTTVAP